MVNQINDRVNEKVCVITGGSSGFGKVLADQFICCGYKVGVCSRNAEKKSGVNFLSCKADVRNLNDMERFFQTVIEKFLAIDVLIVNSAINIDGLVIKINDNQVDQIFETNLKGFFNTIKPALPFFLKKNHGHIIAVTSFAGSYGTYGQSIYSATKTGLIGAVKSLAKEVGEYGVCVNAVMPGFLDVGMGFRTDSKTKELAKRNNVLGRLACPYESAGFITCLTGMKGVSGQVFNLDSRILSWI